MSHLRTLCLGIGVLAACGESPAGPANHLASDPAGSAIAPSQTLTNNLVFPVTFSSFIPCANGGSGEEVAFAGDVHQVVHVTLTGKGRAILMAHIQWQGVTGTGLVTGDKYTGVSVSHSTETLAVGVEETFTFNFRLIGQGSGNDLMMHNKFHVTVNPDGSVSSFHDNFGGACK